MSKWIKIYLVIEIILKILTLICLLFLEIESLNSEFAYGFHHLIVVYIIIPIFSILSFLEYLFCKLIESKFAAIIIPNLFIIFGITITIYADLGMSLNAISLSLIYILSFSILFLIGILISIIIYFENKK